VGDAHVARQIGDPLAVLKHLGGHAVALALEYPAAGGARRNAAGILATMLQVVETLVQVDSGLGARRVGEDETENAAHVARPVTATQKDRIKERLCWKSRASPMTFDRNRLVNGSVVEGIHKVECRSRSTRESTVQAGLVATGVEKGQGKKGTPRIIHGSLFTAVAEGPRAKGGGKGNPNVIPFSKS
jgi:hypothetical protein